jgi:hypothetical protein
LYISIAVSGDTQSPNKSENNGKQSDNKTLDDLCTKGWRLEGRPEFTNSRCSGTITDAGSLKKVKAGSHVEFDFVFEVLATKKVEKGQKRDVSVKFDFVDTGGQQQTEIEVGPKMKKKICLSGQAKIGGRDDAGGAIETSINAGNQEDKLVAAVQEKLLVYEIKNGKRGRLIDSAYYRSYSVVVLSK